MEKENFDEYQIITRQKIAYQSLFITFTLVLINGWISTDHTWASPMIQAFVIIVIPTLYFVTCTVLKNAYLSNKTKFPLIQAFLFIGLGVLDVVVSFNAYTRGGVTSFIADGKLIDGVTPILLAIFFFYIGGIILAKYLLEKEKDIHE